MEGRRRKVNVENMSDESLKKLEEEIGKRVSAIWQEAAEKANELLNIYGLEVLVNYKLRPKTSEEKTKKE